MKIATDLYNPLPLFELEMAKYRLTFSTNEPVEISGLIPELRSRLGFILKARFCPFQNFRAVSCTGCERSSTCLYTLLFSPLQESVNSLFKGEGRVHRTPARPYMLDVFFQNDQQTINPEETGQVELTLFGRKTIQYQRPLLESLLHALTTMDFTRADRRKKNQARPDCPLLPLAWETLAPRPDTPRTGTDTTRTDNKAARFQLKGETYIINDLTPVPLKKWIAALPVPETISNNQGNLMLDISFRTAFQMERAGDRVTFTAFMQSILSRLRDLKRIYHPENNMGHFPKPFYDKSDSVTALTNLNTVSKFCYSYSQGKKIQLGGLTGNLIFKGDITPFLPMLAAGYLCGIGKKCVYGLGHFNLYSGDYWKSTSSEV